jgi:hypothetical protein
LCQRVANADAHLLMFCHDTTQTQRDVKTMAVKKNTHIDGFTWISLTFMPNMDEMKLKGM